mmetsp:Transcript_27525/g.53476  ORF Transcript_27525/g.53476 Transcript_27525/m.53476 type:complete len:197 (+) Transcript_27525:1-591(+)
MTSKRITGTALSCDAGKGQCDMRAIYANTVNVTAGEILTGSVHGDITMATLGGKLTIESGMDGNLKVHTNGGEADIQLGSSAKEVAVNSAGGEVHMRVPSDLEAKVDAKGDRGVLIDEALKEGIKYTDMTCQVASGVVSASQQTSGARGYTPTKATVTIDAGTGFVELRGKDWLSSLGSKFQKLRELKTLRIVQKW